MSLSNIVSLSGSARRRQAKTVAPTSSHTRRLLPRLPPNPTREIQPPRSRKSQLRRPRPLRSSLPHQRRHLHRSLQARCRKPELIFWEERSARGRAREGNKKSPPWTISLFSVDFIGSLTGHGSGPVCGCDEAAGEEELHWDRQAVQRDSCCLDSVHGS